MSNDDIYPGVRQPVQLHVPTFLNIFRTWADRSLVVRAPFTRRTSDVGSFSALWFHKAVQESPWVVRVAVVH